MIMKHNVTLFTNFVLANKQCIEIRSPSDTVEAVLNQHCYNIIRFFFIKLIPEYEKITNGFSPYKSIYGENIYDDYSKHSIQIKTSSIKDAIILLINIETGLPIRNVYVNKGTNYTMSNIPPGKYTVKTYQGNYWNSEIIKNGIKGGFQLDEIYAEDSDPNDIWVLRRNTTGGGSFTLYSKEGGNLETKNISRQEFFTK